MNLTQKECRRVNKEGWGLFEAEGSRVNSQGNWPLQIQKVDELGLFEDDEDVHQLIVDRVMAGSNLHLKVLKILRLRSKPELCLLLGGGDWQHCQLTHDKELDELETRVFGRVVSRLPNIQQ